MAIYRQPRNGKDFYRTKSYKFTVASKDDPSLIDLRTNIVKHNASVRNRARTYQTLTEYDKLYTVRLMARGPRRWHTKYKNSFRYFKGAYGIPQHQKMLHSNADSNLNHRFAEEFDVYVHRSREMEDALIDHAKDNSYTWYDQESSTRDVAKTLLRSGVKFSKDKTTGRETKKYAPRMKFNLPVWEGRMSCKVFSNEGEEIKSIEEVDPPNTAP